MKYVNRLLRDVSIRWKVVALILSVAAISLLLAGAGLLLNARTNFERETEQKLTSLADVVGVNSTAALAFQDLRAATETLAALRGDPHVMAGGLYDGQGRLFARFLREDVDTELPDPAPEVDGLTFRDDRAMLLRTIELKGQPIARVYLVADTGQWSGTLWHFVGVLGALFAAVLSVGFLVAIWLQPLITQPIAELAGLMRRAGRERDYALRAPKRGDDELGILADGFNEMLAEIGKRRVELEGARDELAQRVAELDTEVAERRRTETELRRSREQLANFIEYANIGLHWVGADGIILWANRYELETLGYSAEQYVGRHCTELHADPAVAEELMARLGRHETFENFEARLRNRDGSLRYVLINASPYVEDGKFVHTRCFTRDISERKRVEDALRHSEERYRTLVAATSAVVFTTDATGKAIERHPSWEGYTGQSWEKCAGDGWLEMVHPDDRVRVQTDWTGAATDAAVYEVEVRVWHARSQEYRYCVARAIPRRHSDGSIREWIGTVADIDERKRAEEQMRLAVDAAPNAMIMIDEHGRIVLANRELETLFGYTRAELIGQSVEILVPERLRRVHPSYRTKFFAEPHARSMGGGRDLHGKHKDGRQVPVEIGLNPFTTRDGVFCLASIIDITERKRAELELRRFTDELQRSNRELAQFAYVASHDLQEPLRAISGCVQLLQQRYEKKLDERADELIQHAVSGTGRMQALINDLLTYSRVGTRTKPFEQCDLSRPLREALANLDLAIKECGAQVVADQMPVLDADPTQLTQLFQNLIANALKFRGDREPHIHVGAERKSGGQLIYVRDNGIGIEPQYFERIFGVFQRLHSRSKYPGNGIGLALCRKIVERHSGRIWVESEPGKGSTFYFTLPGEGAQNEQPERYSQRQ